VRVQKNTVKSWCSRKKVHIIASSNKRAFKSKCWKNRTMLFGSWRHD